eukprot:2829573-Prorocentrum_lima.AAC.1
MTQDFNKELEGLNATIHMQGQEAALLQGQLLPLQDRISVEEQAARDEENKLCQKLIDDELKHRDEFH